MQRAAAPRRRRRFKSCTECQRRKQKCVMRGKAGECVQCAKRFPPVECIFPNAEERSNAAGEVSPADVEVLVERFKRCLVIDGQGYTHALRPFGGIITQISCLNSAWLPDTARTAELLHFYVRFVVPNMLSIDSESPPQIYMQTIVPWMLQSPVYPTIGMLMSSVIQSMIVGSDEAVASREIATLNARVFSLMRDFIQNNSVNAWAEELLGCTINLLVFEWLWGHKDIWMMHMKGTRDILQLHGGYRKVAELVKDDVKTLPIILADYVIACCYEKELFMLDGDPAQTDYAFIPNSIPEGSQCPLVPTDVGFNIISENLGISDATAKLLDDIRFLTVCLNTRPRGDEQNVRNTASWLYRRLTANLPPAAAPDASGSEAAKESDGIQESLRIAAIIYTWAISSGEPMSMFNDQSLRQQLFVAVLRVSAARWQKIPGIYLFIVLVAGSGVPDDFQGRFLRRKTAVALVTLGSLNFPLAISCVRAFWLVQRWIVSTGRAGRRASEGTRRAIPSALYIPHND